MTESKCQKKNKKKRDCTMCKHFGGFVSWNYYACTAYKTEEYPKDIDIYDRDVLKKGSCGKFEPIEMNLFQDWNENDDLHINDAVECSLEKDDQSLPDKE